MYGVLTGGLLKSDFEISYVCDSVVLELSLSLRIAACMESRHPPHLCHLRRPKKFAHASIFGSRPTSRRNFSFQLFSGQDLTMEFPALVCFRC